MNWGKLRCKIFGHKIRLNMNFISDAQYHGEPGRDACYMDYRCDRCGVSGVDCQYMPLAMAQREGAFDEWYERSEENREDYERLIAKPRREHFEAMLKLEKKPEPQKRPEPQAEAPKPNVSPKKQTEDTSQRLDSERDTLQELIPVIVELVELISDQPEEEPWSGDGGSFNGGGADGEW